MTRWGWPQSPMLAAWLAAGVCVSVATLAFFGIRATREFERSSQLLGQQRADQGARLLATALTRDMRAAQTAVLPLSAWDEFQSDAPHEVIALVATTFARYPYPDTFLAWNAHEPSSKMVFYARSDRPPRWAAATADLGRSPVRVLTDPRVAALMASQIDSDEQRGQLYSVFDIDLDAVRYQVVIRLRYHDRLRQSLASVYGFMVNLSWVRQHYFAELTRQVADIGSNTGLSFGIVDHRGEPVIGKPELAETGLSSRQTFSFAFFDPLPVAANMRDEAFDLQTWTVLVSGTADPTLGAAIRGADVIFGLAAVAAVMLAFGLVMTARAMRTGVELAEMRAEFMSSITHELKTPIASIRAMGDMLTRGRLRHPDDQREYAAVVSQEAKRLERLVNNVLAHARITDVADVYSFEPLDVEELVSEVLKGFKHQLHRGGFRITVDLQPDLPRIQGDRAAMELLLDNLIDNAIRHSRNSKELRIEAIAREDGVALVIADRGVGIPVEDLGRVTQKFVRGRNAVRGGSGLGLAIVNRIAKDHGGRVAIESVLDRGTTVTVVLPVAQIEAATTYDTELPPLPGAIRPSTSSPP
ncbi:MAG: HAMP domain-containing histidine kinase [Acidobacteria bacterium]|nr:HAMP domain-containing histidine kinase [Acidobacteriota bacterium]